MAQNGKGQILKPRILHRGHIKKALENIFTHRMFFVTTGMGFGKTTAVRDFLKKKRKVKSIWFTFEEDDTEDIWTWVKFCHSIKMTNAQLGEKMFENGMPRTELEIEHLITMIKSFLGSDSIVVVLDDMHLCKSQELISIIMRMADTDIQQLHFVLIARTETIIDTDDLVRQHKAYSLEQDEFCFSKTEIDDFFVLNDMPLDSEQVDFLYEKTSGWTSAIYLALLHYHAHGTLDDIEFGMGLMKSAVYDRFSEEERMLLLKISKLNNFTLDQAQFVTSKRAIRNIIIQLHESNCFIKFDQKAGIYSFHEMLRNLLLEEFEKEDVDEREIYIRQGEWCVASGNRIEAIAAFSKAKDYEQVLDIMSGRYASALMNTAPFVIARAFEKMDFETKISNPIGYLTFIYSYGVIIDIKKGTKMLKEAASYYKRMDDLPERDQVLGEIALIESVSAFNNIDKMFECYKRANRYFHGGTSRIFNSDIIITYGVPLTLFMYHQHPGGMLHIVELVEEEFNIFNTIANGCGAGYEYLIRGEYEYLTGNVEKAEMYAFKALYKARAREQHDIVLSASFLLLRIAISRGDVKQIDEILLQLMQEVENLENPIMLCCYEFIVAYVYSHCGKYDQIPRWLREGNVAAAKLMAPARDTSHVIIAEILCEKGDYTKLEEMCPRMQELYQEKKNLIGVIISLIFESICIYHTSGLKEARKPLEKALELAEPDGCFIQFAEHAHELLPILEDIGTPFANKIIPYAKQFIAARKKLRSPSNHKIPLTKRECEVMDLVTEGYTAEAISKILFVSHSTVKKHIASSYEKLGVNKKADAIASYKKFKKN